MPNSANEFARFQNSGGSHAPSRMARAAFRAHRSSRDVVPGSVRVALAEAPRVGSPACLAGVVASGRAQHLVRTNVSVVAAAATLDVVDLFYFQRAV